MGFALSTSWNAFRYSSGKKLVFEIKELGFDQIELSFNLTSGMVSEIEKLTQQKKIEIISLHNYCPIPKRLNREKALPDCFSVASLDEDERRKAIKYSKITIDTAARLNAKAVVLHCGRVEMPDRTRELINLFSKGLKYTEMFRLLKQKMEEEREDLKKRFLEKSLKSLDSLNKYAVKKNIYLGIENRFYFREIPSFKETGIILKKFKGGKIFYWHDNGHAQVMENLGFGMQNDYLEAYAQKMIGMHLHDISVCTDHLPPGKGEFDFKILTGYVKPQTYKVIEAHQPARVSDLIKGRTLLEKVFKCKDS